MSNNVAIPSTEKLSCFSCSTGVTFDKACRSFTISLSILGDSISKESWTGGVRLHDKLFCSRSLMKKIHEVHFLVYLAHD